MREHPNSPPASCLSITLGRPPSAHPFPSAHNLKQQTLPGPPQ